MTQAVDATLLAELETQYRELDCALARLEVARTALIPGRATFWRGAARSAFDGAVGALAETIDSAVDSVSSARTFTNRAISMVASGA